MAFGDIGKTGPERSLRRRVDHPCPRRAGVLIAQLGIDGFPNNLCDRDASAAGDPSYPCMLRFRELDLGSNHVVMITKSDDMMAFDQDLTTRQVFGDTGRSW